MRNEEEEEEECNGVIGSSVVYGVGTLYGATIQLPPVNMYRLQQSLENGYLSVCK